MPVREMERAKHSTPSCVLFAEAALMESTKKILPITLKPLENIAWHTWRVIIFSAKDKTFPIQPNQFQVQAQEKRSSGFPSKVFVQKIINFILFDEMIYGIILKENFPAAKNESAFQTTLLDGKLMHYLPCFFFRKKRSFVDFQDVVWTKLQFSFFSSKLTIRKNVLERRQYSFPIHMLRIIISYSTLKTILFFGILIQSHWHADANRPGRWPEHRRGRARLGQISTNKASWKNFEIFLSNDIEII